MKQQDYINDFFIFLLKTNPDTVNRILKDLKNEGKCGNAPDIALKVSKELRQKDIIKRLAKIEKSDIFSFLLTAGNLPLLKLITNLVNELATAKIKGCVIPQDGGSKKRSSKKKRAKTPKKTPKKISAVKQKSPCFRDKVAKVMGEFKRGKLKTSAGMKVTNRSQAIAIALSMGDRYC